MYVDLIYVIFCVAFDLNFTLEQSLAWAGVAVQVTVRNVFDLAGNPAANATWSFVGASHCSRAAFSDSFTSFALSFVKPSYWCFYFL